jgi:spore maturation protein CgeB
VKLAIVGYRGGTNIGASLERAARARAHAVDFFDAAEAGAGPAPLRALAWRLGRRPLRLRAFSSRVVDHYRDGEAPQLLVSTGTAALDATALRALRARGTLCVNYSTDDPWSPVHRSRWHLRALPEFDIVFTARRANLGDLDALGCRAQYLPFGYDADIFHPSSAPEKPQHDVLFVGGADEHRVAFIEEFVRDGPPVTVAGDYWERHASTAGRSLGHLPPEGVVRATRAARVNLCLVRRLNRDGHVMRSLEAAALGACMLVEDTQEHRELFGPDEQAVCYFRSAAEAARVAKRLLQDPREIARLAQSAQRKVTSGAHTYGDRLEAMISSALKLRQA